MGKGAVTHTTQGTINGPSHITTKINMYALVLNEALEKLNMFHPILNHLRHEPMARGLRALIQVSAAFSLSFS